MKESKTPLSQERILATDEFIEKNLLQLRPQNEISEKFQSLRDDAFGFRAEVLIDYLSFENAKPFLKEEYVKEVAAGTKKWEQITTIQECCQNFLDYMNFAWGKAEDQRGLSASRSINKLGMWLWLMSREDLTGVIETDELYNPYGAPALIEVCNKMGIKVPDSLVEFSKVKCE